MYLASPDEIRAQLGFDNTTDINVAIGDALDAIETQLAAALRTDFDQVSVTDTFSIDRFELLGGTPYTEILLTRGFLQSVPVSATVLQASSVFLSGDVLLSGNASIIPSFVWSPAALEKGCGIDITNRYEAALVAVTYTAGFAPDTSNAPDEPISYLLDDGTHPVGSVPRWLQQLAKQMSMLMLSDSPVVTEAGAIINTKLAEQQSRLTISRKVRYKPVAFAPIVSALAS